MAQGKMKVKGNFQRKQKKPLKKQLGPKRNGGRNIAPKKAQKVKEKNMKSTLEKAINASIEQELANKAGTKSLAVVKVTSTTADASNKGTVTNKKIKGNSK